MEKEISAPDSEKSLEQQHHTEEASPPQDKAMCSEKAEKYEQQQQKGENVEKRREDADSESTAREPVVLAEGVVAVDEAPVEKAFVAEKENQELVDKSEGPIEEEIAESKPAAATAKGTRRRNNPSLIPRSGYFFEHDNRESEAKKEAESESTAVNGEVGSKERKGNEEATNKGRRKPRSTAQGYRNNGSRGRNRKYFPRASDRDETLDKWSHDRFDEEKQMPKSKTELIKRYGYDIRENEEEEEEEEEKAEAEAEENEKIRKELAARYAREDEEDEANLEKKLESLRRRPVNSSGSRQHARKSSGEMTGNSSNNNKKSVKNGENGQRQQTSRQQCSGDREIRNNNNNCNNDNNKNEKNGFNSNSKSSENRNSSLNSAKNYNNNSGNQQHRHQTCQNSNSHTFTNTSKMSSQEKSSPNQSMPQKPSFLRNENNNNIHQQQIQINNNAPVQSSEVPKRYSSMRNQHHQPHQLTNNSPSQQQPQPRTVQNNNNTKINNNNSYSYPRETSNYSDKSISTPTNVYPNVFTQVYNSSPPSASPQWPKNTAVTVSAANLAYQAMTPPPGLGVQVQIATMPITPPSITPPQQQQQQQQPAQYYYVPPNDYNTMAAALAANQEYALAMAAAQLIQSNPMYYQATMAVSNTNQQMGSPPQPQMTASLLGPQQQHRHTRAIPIVHPQRFDRPN